MWRSVDIGIFVDFMSVECLEGIIDTTFLQLVRKATCKSNSTAKQIYLSCADFT